VLLNTTSLRKDYSLHRTNINKNKSSFVREKTDQFKLRCYLAKALLEHQALVATLLLVHLYSLHASSLYYEHLIASLRLRLHPLRLQQLAPYLSVAAENLGLAGIHLQEGFADHVVAEALAVEPCF
jgi:hypothetical protein